ncbi:hypothetical protein [Novosphingobium sp. Rr 2-17]|uniref:hypothetical protein n=1 Tax=Novosphingobium sp. Rr 2-17 TaxID=555793 RepID=UPI0012F6C8CC|nr:hypothetical protein [Novosphingobium sp. Rr 2-17]
MVRSMDADGIIGGGPVNRLRRFGRAINIACFFLLLLVMGTVIYGLILRAIWERSYYIAVAFAILGAVALLLGLAQQEIAARDRATWRAMAEWQLRATYDRIAARRGEAQMQDAGDLGDGFDLYYENLIEAIIDDMQRVTGESRHV